MLTTGAAATTTIISGSQVIVVVDGLEGRLLEGLVVRVVVPLEDRCHQLAPIRS